MLYLIGVGLEEGDMTLKGRDAMKKCSKLFIEDYTSFPYEIEGAEHLKRSEVESDFLIKLAETEDIALLIGGDPLFATTHISLMLGCKEKGVEFKAIHAPSVINTLSRTGLSPYKFGRIVTISQNLNSDREKLEKNLEAGLHTLCLINPGTPVLNALEVLIDMGISSKAVYCERLGTKDEVIIYDDLKNLLQIKPGKKPHSIIIPSILQFFEEDYLNTLRPHK